MNETIQVINGDCRTKLKRLPESSVRCCITSPPYWAAHSFGENEEAIGQEKTPSLFIDNLVDAFRGVYEALKWGGSLWLNIGDTYSNYAYGRGGWGADYRIAANHKFDSQLPHRNLIGIPWRLALALQADGWIVRSDIIWHKSKGVMDNALGRPRRVHEYVFLLTKGEHYRFNNLGLNTIWEIPKTTGNGSKRLNFAVFPEKLVERCILSSTNEGDIVLDPFAGTGTVGKVALRLGRKAILIESNPDLCCQTMFENLTII